MSLKSTCPGSKIQDKSALKKLRISAHKVHIENGTYKKFDKFSKTYVNTPREQRTCSSCTNKIEDEYDFLFECSKNLELRQNFKISKGMTVALVIKIIKIKSSYFYLPTHNLYMTPSKDSINKDANKNPTDPSLPILPISI